MENNREISDLIVDENFVEWVVKPDEASSHYWSVWLANHPHRKKDLEMARQVIESMQYKHHFEMKEKDFDMVLSNIVSHAKYEPDHDRIGISLPWRRIIGIAASLIILLTATFLILDASMGEVNDKKLTKEKVTKTTLPGQKMTIKLPDGTKVMLNAGSQLSYQVPFVKQRKVELTGEGFFEVVRDERKPFIVRSGAVRTEVLGTSFNVKAYPGEEQTTVSVVTGKVHVSDDLGHEASLSPELQGVFDEGKRQLLVAQFSRYQVIGWKDGIIQFEDIPLQSVFLQLERWYGVKIKVSNEKLLKSQYTGRYINASLEEVLDGIGYASGFEFDLGKEEIVITNKN
ncbi:MAG: FecR domain-containing protein [Cyclobacteriaceae bacterium]|nr:FecR domain-containing protein [Cyclobacteriaceae bacterium HetDA_MAG_MS6]